MKPPVWTARQVAREIDAESYDSHIYTIEPTRGGFAVRKRGQLIAPPPGGRLGAALRKAAFWLALALAVPIGVLGGLLQVPLLLLWIHFSDEP